MSPSDAVVVVPSLKISGGIREAMRLATDLRDAGLPTTLLSMWASPHAMESTVPVTMLSTWRTRISRAAFELPVLQYRFARWLREKGSHSTPLIFTHYATLPLSLLVPRQQRYFFVQGLEWKFVRNGILSSLLRSIVLGTYRTGRIISANAYLTAELADEGLDVAFDAPIWADPFFADRTEVNRDIDFAMVLRKGGIKRVDLYRRFIALARARGLRLAVITPEDDIAESVRGQVEEVVLRPSEEEMKVIYGRSKCFVHLSELEGFGLPPLEAMGSGCVPICRDSGGVRVFMRDTALADNLLPLDTPIEVIFDQAVKVVADAQAWKRLSVVARERFDSGLREVAGARNRLAAALMSQAAR